MEVIQDLVVRERILPNHKSFLQQWIEAVRNGYQGTFKEFITEKRALRQKRSDIEIGE